MSMRTRLAAMALAAVLAVLGMACEQQDGGEPLEEGNGTDGTETPADGASPSPTPTPTPEEGGTDS